MPHFKMQSLTSLLLILALILLLALVSADDNNKLVRTVCRETGNPTVCLKCLDDSDSDADVATRPAIAASVITCLRSGGASVGADMAGIASKSLDTDRKRVFGKCGASYADSNKDLAAAVALVTDAKYDAAEKAVAGALYRQYLCADEIEELKNKIELEREVLYKMTVYEELCKVAERIIERL